MIFLWYCEDKQACVKNVSPCGAYTKKFLRMKRRLSERRLSRKGRSTPIFLKASVDTRAEPARPRLNCTIIQIFIFQFRNCALLMIASRITRVILGEHSACQKHFSHATHFLVLDLLYALRERSMGTISLLHEKSTRSILVNCVNGSSTKLYGKQEPW